VQASRGLEDGKGQSRALEEDDEPPRKRYASSVNNTARNQEQTLRAGLTEAGRRQHEDMESFRPTGEGAKLAGASFASNAK